MTAMADPIFSLGPCRLKLSRLWYCTFTIIGITLLWPWNCFLSASAYYGQRLAHTPSFVKIYLLTMMTVSTIVSTTYSCYLSQAQRGVDYSQRIRIGLVVTIVVFALMAVSCVSDWFIRMNDGVFLIFLIGMVLVSAMATCLAQNGTMATVNLLSPVYTNAVMVGQAIAGTLAALALILSVLVVGTSPHTAAKNGAHVDKKYGVFVYYITASLISVASIALLALTRYIQTEAQYMNLNMLSEEGSADMGVGTSDDLDNWKPETYNAVPNSANHAFVPFTVLWAKLKLIFMTIFVTFSVTLLFPVFAAVVESVHTDSPSRFFQKSIYIPFIYFVWNLGDLLGRVLCGAANSVFLVSSPTHLIKYAMLRFLFIPLLMTCNIHPSGLVPIVASDTWYILLQFLFGFSNGQLATSCFMVVGDHCDSDDEKKAAGGCTTVFLNMGLAVGSALSYLLVFLIG